MVVLSVAVLMASRAAAFERAEEGEQHRIPCDTAREPDEAPRRPPQAAADDAY